ncbi:MAG: signal peptidase I [bacterium]|nr:signal peptidase I [bacterium]
MLNLYKVSGNSMNPALNDGEYILSEKLSYLFTKPKVSDIIIFKALGDKNLVKRIKSEKDNQYFVEGDNQGFSGLVDRKLILEKLLFKI